MISINQWTKLSARKKPGSNSKEKHILIVSSNVVHKRMSLAKEIFDYIKSIEGDVKMIKAGYGGVLIGEDIINVGWIPEEKMPILFNSADVYLHSSEYEGFGLPVLEAMACGIPEIAGDYNSFVGLDEDNITQITEKIPSLVDKGVDNEAMEQKFSWRKTAEETMKVYEEVLQSS